MGTSIALLTIHSKLLLILVVMEEVRTAVALLATQKLLQLRHAVVVQVGTFIVYVIA